MLRHDNFFICDAAWRAVERTSIYKAIAVGLASGLAASWAMGQTHRAILNRVGNGSSHEQSEDPTLKVARAVSLPVLDRELTQQEKETAGPLVHYAFGSSMAAAYAVAAEFLPSVTAGEGIPFGAAVWLAAHVIAVPALGLTPPISQSSVPSEFAEFLAHLSYGAVTEFLRSRLRSLLG